MYPTLKGLGRQLPVRALDRAKEIEVSGEGQIDAVISDDVCSARRCSKQVGVALFVPP